MSVLATEGIRKYYVGLSDQEMVLGAEFSQNSDKEMEEGSGDGNENADELPESVDIANKTRSLSLGSSEIQSSKTSTNEKKQSQKLNEGVEKMFSIFHCNERLMSKCICNTRIQRINQ